MGTAVSKITRQQMMIIGAVLAALIAGGIYYFLMRPLAERRAAADAKYEAAEQIALTRRQKEDAKKKAEEEVRKAEAQWRVYDRRYMYSRDRTGNPTVPLVDTSNLLRAMQQRWTEQSTVLGSLATQFLRSDNTVRVVQANIAVAPPPVDPNQAADQLVRLSLGTVTVSGTFENILRHAERWNRFKRLVLVDNLTLSGNSPRLTGQYTLTCFIFAHSGDTPPAAVPRAAGTAGAGAGNFPGAGIPGEGGLPGEGGPPPDEGSGGAPAL